MASMEKIKRKKLTSINFSHNMLKRKIKKKKIEVKKWLSCPYNA